MGVVLIGLEGVVDIVELDVVSDVVSDIVPVVPLIEPPVVPDIVEPEVVPPVVPVVPIVEPLVVPPMLPPGALPIEVPGAPLLTPVPVEVPDIPLPAEPALVCAIACPAIIVSAQRSAVHGMRFLFPVMINLHEDRGAAHPNATGNASVHASANMEGNLRRGVKNWGRFR